MSRYVRVIRRSRWDLEAKPEWVGDADMPADPLADLCTQENKLSLWEIQSDGDLRRCVSAVAATRQHLSNLDCLLFEAEVCENLTIPIGLSPGNTPDDEVNAWHRDAENLTASKLINLGRILWDSGERRRFLPQEVRAGLMESVERGAIERRKLPDAVRAKISITGRDSIR